MLQTSSSLKDALRIDPARETERIGAAIRATVFSRFRRKGAVIAVSGGIDSSVVAFLCARALGKTKVLPLSLPEMDSSPDNSRLAQMVADALGIPLTTEDITGCLRAAHCYERRDAAIRSLLPGYGEGWRSKIVLPAVEEHSEYSLFWLVVQDPDGRTTKLRLNLDAYLGIVAATNLKQRTRKMMEYYYADRLHYAVAGTPNRLEYDQGFFVKNGDGAADFKPIAHLYKSQVYQLADYLGVPREIQERPPSTDTYSMPQSQEEFYFSLPLAKMDFCLYGRDMNLPAAEVAAAIGLTAAEVEHVYHMIDSKRRVADYLRAQPVLVEPSPLNEHAR